MKRIFSFPQLSPNLAPPSRSQGKLSRRTLLRGAGGAALALPFLEMMGRPERSWAAAPAGLTAEGFPKRFLVWFTPNGTIAENWTPNGSGSNFEFSRILKPLEPFKDKLLIIDGVDQTGSGGDGHQNGMQGMLTGQTLNPGPFGGGDGGSAGWANGVSVDQRIAQSIGQTTPFQSLELGVLSSSGENNWTRMSLTGPDQPVPPENNPYKAFDRIFSDFSADPDKAALDNQRQRVVLSAVSENIRALNKKLGKEDRVRLEQHLELVSDLEARLGRRPSAALDACKVPTMGEPVETWPDSNFPTIGKLQMDLMVMALACDLTRVGSLMWSNSVGGVNMNFVDPSIDRGHHDYSHDGDSNADSIEKLTKINVWYAEQFAYFLGQLDSIAEGDGTMLDNTVVFWCNELSRGNSHSRDDSHYVVAGGAKYFQMGRCLKFKYEDSIKHNNLLLSFLHSMGIEASSFGKEDWCTGPLSGMTATG